MYFFRHKTKQLRLVYFSLFAVAMLTLGPFTSQVLVAMSKMLQTSVAAQQLTQASAHTQHHHPTSPTKHNTANSRMPTHHTMNLCGYCDLLHTPVIATYIPVVIESLSVHQETIYYHFHSFFLSPYNYPSSRAPPFFS